MKNTKTNAWQSFLDKVFNGDKCLIKKVRRLLGESLKRSSENIVSQFLASGRIQACKNSLTRFSEAYAAYLDWHKANRQDEPLLKKVFAHVMSRRFELHSVGGHKYFNGLTVS